MPIAHKVKPVRALERGLDVLAEVRRSGAIGLHDLHLAVRLPKATLLRMLVTLAEHGLVWQRLADGRYLPGGGEGEARLAEIASPLLAELSCEVAWPSALAVPALDHMRLIETTSPLLRLDAAVLGPVGTELSFVHTSVGRAWLATLDDAERAAVIDRIRPPGASAASETALASILNETAARGWASRDPAHDWPGRSAREVQADGRRSIAVPVPGEAGAIAAINLTWPMRRMSEAEVVKRHLAKLQRAAERIAAALSDAGQPTRRSLPPQ